MSSFEVCSDDWSDFNSASVELANLSLRTGARQEGARNRTRGAQASGSKSVASRSFLSSLAVRMVRLSSDWVSRETRGDGGRLGRAKGCAAGSGGGERAVGLEISA